MSLFLRVKELAEQRGMTIRALELQCGFGNGTIRKWENQSPSFDKVVRLANELNVSLNYLATGAEESPQTNTTPTLSPGEQAIYEQVHPLSEPEKFKLAGALPFIRLLQEAPMSVPEAAREHTAVGLFVGSTSRD